MNSKSTAASMAEQAYLDLCERARQAERDGDSLTCFRLRERLAACSKATYEKLKKLQEQFGEGDMPSTEAGLRSPGSVAPGAPLEVAKPSAVEIRQFDWGLRVQASAKATPAVPNTWVKGRIARLQKRLHSHRPNRQTLLRRSPGIDRRATREGPQSTSNGNAFTGPSWTMAHKAADSNDDELAAKFERSLEEGAPWKRSRC